MVGFSRKKRVTDPFDEEAKARLVRYDFRQLSYVSSGSDHSGDGDGDSPCLSELVHAFLEDNGNENDHDPTGNDLDSERVDSVSDCMYSVEDLLNLSDANNVDPYKNMLRAHVSEAAEKFAYLREQNASAFQRNVMSLLREKGHNAAICKTRWESSTGVTAGNHEFIDVVKSGPSTWQKRYFVDVDFASQFEIARPTSQYSEMLSYVPGIFVGTAEELKRTVWVMCGVVKKCFRSIGLSVPPWRKNRYMQNKWFAPYRRTTNPVHGYPDQGNQVQGNPVQGIVTEVSVAKRRFVGFDDAVLEAGRGGVFVQTR